MKNSTFVFAFLLMILSVTLSAQADCSMTVSVTQGTGSGKSCTFEGGGVIAQMWAIQIAAGTNIPSYKNSFIVTGTIVKNGIPSVGYFVFHNKIFNSQSAASSFASTKYTKGCYVVKRLDGRGGIFSQITVVYE